MSGLSTCRDCGQWIYWDTREAMDGSQRNVPFSDSSHTRLHWEDCAAQDFVTDALGNSYRVTKCSKCKHSVYWETTARGKKRPMDVLQDEDTGEYSAAGECHFETCVGQASGSNWRNGDSYSGSRRKQETKSESSSRSREKAGSYDQRRIEPWLRDLRLSWPATRSDVTRAFRKMALETHPDMGGTDQAFIKVKVAYDQLRKLVPA